MNRNLAKAGWLADPTARWTTLDRMFRARGVAVLGASSDAAKIGGKPVALMRRHFGGTVAPINPNRTTIAGLACSPDIASLGFTPDMAVVTVPAAVAEAAVADCVNAGVRAITLFTAGFAETGAEGLAAQQRIAARCAAAGARLLGPNSLGFINFHDRLYATFSSALDNVWPKPGNVGIASQSGAVGTYIMALAAERGVGLSHFIATGNEADVDVADCVAWLAADPRTSVIVAYLEGCRDGGRLKVALEMAAAAKKPVIAIKPGVSEASVAAVASHTGMLAGSKRVFDAVLNATGAWLARSMDEAVDIAYVCGLGKFPAPSEAMIVTPSGGVGIMLADACDAAGMRLANPDPATGTRIREILPLASTGNPIDTTAQVANDFGLFGKVVEIAAETTKAPILFVFMAHMGKTPAVTDLLSPILADLSARHPDKLVVLITRASDEFRARMATAGCLVFEEPARAAAAVGALCRFAAKFAEAQDEPVTMAPLAAERLRAASASPKETARLLDTIGVPQIPVYAAASEEEAVEAATHAGYPIALKIDSPDIQHKTEVGGVRLDLTGEAALRAAWRSMMATVATAAPAACIAGATVSPMLYDGIEVIVGTSRDADFGPVVMVGLGGVLAEALDDVVIAPAPLSRAAARKMISSLRGARVLDGWRGAAPADKEALVETICALAAFAAANDAELESIEVNPFRVLPKGGAALDILIQLRSSEWA